jgi:hypothetical protein
MKGARIPALEEVLEASCDWNLRNPMLIEIKQIRSDQCRNDLLDLASQFRKSLNINFLVYPDKFSRAFPDPLRWNALFKKYGFKVYTAAKPKTDEFDLTKDADPEAATWRFTTVLREEHFVIRDQASRTLSYPVALPGEVSQGSSLRVGIYHGYDDAGDKGLRFRLADKRGAELLAGFAATDGWQWFEVPLGTNTGLTLYLEDFDTEFSGEHPGNGGAVKATIVVKQADTFCRRSPPVVY